MHGLIFGRLFVAHRRWSWYANGAQMFGMMIPNLLRLSKRWIANSIIAACGTVVSAPLQAAPTIQPGTTNDLTVAEFLQLVVERNESLQAKVLEFMIAQKRFKAERGAFEPELVLSYDRVENKRENTAEQRRSSGVAVFEEKNNIYNAGIDALIPTGGKIRLGYVLRDL